ncbi:MAG TPA: hypothetical protein VFD27_06085 [Chthoniobacteraceae bacterium]|nr:hypothetical protein [Chthoniobacteraceae bacterium]
MKALLRFAMTTVCAANALAADERPALPIDKALGIAQKYLADGGHARGTAISSLAIERAAFGSSKMNWFAKWAPTIVLPDGRKELGLEIQMDGTFARIVDKKARN